MKSTHAQFLQDVLNDSAMLEQTQEPGQAFDKLARGIESRLPGQEGQSQNEKARSFFLKRVTGDEVWSVLRENVSRIGYFAEELSYGVSSTAQSEARELRRYATELQHVVQAEDRQTAALCLANLFMLLRNKRFHGHPAFSGRNIRVSISAEAALAVLRCCLQRELADIEAALGGEETRRLERGRPAD